MRGDEDEGLLDGHLGVIPVERVVPIAAYGDLILSLAAESVQVNILLNKRNILAKDASGLLNINDTHPRC